MNVYTFLFYFYDEFCDDYDFHWTVRAERLNAKIFNEMKSVMRQNNYSLMVILKNNEYMTEIQNLFSYQNKFVHTCTVTFERVSVFKKEPYETDYYFEGDSIKEIKRKIDYYNKGFLSFRIVSYKFKTIHY